MGEHLPLRWLRLALAPAFLISCGFNGSQAGGNPDAGTNPDGVDSGTSLAACGDSIRTALEQCDDGNVASGDGCSDQCEVEEDFACPQSGHECVRVVVCGNGRIEGDETCDDRNTVAADGCDSDCQRELGWSCVLAGTACVAADCGDGIVAGFEACDDSDTDAGDGCDSQCRLESGYHCPSPGQDCLATVCGDGMVQGLEECDDQNAVVGDGCSPLCTREPLCADGVCVAVCGDSIRWAPEECDDGNNVSGDGCSATCAVEAGFTCQEQPLPDPPQVSLPYTIRDFVAQCGTGARLADDQPGAQAPYGHRDFECYNNGLQTGMVETELDVDGKPVRDSGMSTFSAASFSQWYRSDNNYNRTDAKVMTLASIGAGVYQIDQTSFYPADSFGFNNEDCGGSPCEQLHADGNGAGNRNFHFTTEVRYWFEYAGDELLEFSGDDDVWVFINNRLAVDIGGVHGRRDDSVDLSNAGVAAALGLTVGGIYEVAVFQAERHTTRSQYRLTLTNFNQAPSTCQDLCGDGQVSSREVCDDGSSNGAGNGSDYGGCSITCTLEPYCGDGVVDTQYNEVCDDGLNLGGSASACAPGCQSLGGTCGDGVVQIDRGESCDDGNTDADDGCSELCQIEIL